MKILGLSQENNLFVENTKAIASIEEELKCQLPIRFKEFLSRVEGKVIEINMFDGEKYKFLDSLFEEDAPEQDNVVMVSQNFESYYPNEDKGLIKVPFARTTEGDGFKYLYFMGKEGEELSEKVFLRDTDCVDCPSIPLGKNLSFVIDKVNESYFDKNSISISQEMNYSQMKDLVELPQFIDLLSDEVTVTWEEEIKKINKGRSYYNSRLIIKSYSFKEESKNYIHYALQFKIVLDGQEMYYTVPFKIQAKPQLQYQYEVDIDYRIYYHKLVMYVKAIDLICQKLEAKGYSVPKLYEVINSSYIDRDCVHYMGVENISE